MSSRMNELQGYLPYDVVQVRGRWVIHWVDRRDRDLQMGLMGRDLEAAIDKGAAQKITGLYLSPDAMRLRLGDADGRT